MDLHSASARMTGPHPHRQPLLMLQTHLKAVFTTWVCLPSRINSEMEQRKTIALEYFMGRRAESFTYHGEKKMA